ncbi:MAG: hypothetical protein ACYDCQ_09635 [Dehalococcoidia bacterium]
MLTRIQGLYGLNYAVFVFMHLTSSIPAHPVYRNYHLSGLEEASSLNAL